MGWRELLATSHPTISPPVKERAREKETAVPHEVPNPPQETNSAHAPLPITPPLLMPSPPLQPGWLICYLDRTGRLAGGCDDRVHGTVQNCVWDGRAWTVLLTDGQQIILHRIRSVGKTDPVGQVVSAWTTREHGYNGEGRV